MSRATIDMMAMRRAAFDAMASLPADAAAPFAEIRVDARPHLTTGKPDDVPDSLVQAVSDRVVRDGGPLATGAAVVAGISARLDLPDARRFHENLFRAVWAAVRPRAGAEASSDGYTVKATVTSDGAIPLELYGSAWSFKQLHADRDALLFSHLYGPGAGFTGGHLLLADGRTYLGRHRLRFDDVFTWSEEATPGSKPLLRSEHVPAVMDECGIDLGAIGPDEILFVNNFPSAGILHGVTAVEVVDPSGFVREFHRCSVRGDR
jgi:hypothetical protein